METILIYFFFGLLIGWIIKLASKKAAEKEAAKWEAVRQDILKEAVKEHEEFERWKRSREK